MRFNNFWQYLPWQENKWIQLCKTNHHIMDKSKQVRFMAHCTFTWIAGFLIYWYCNMEVCKYRTDTESLWYICYCFTSGGMCPRCICPLVMCCLAWGMEPIWKLSGPPAPERMMAGRATEPVSTFPTLLNCCCSTVDLKCCYIKKEKEDYWKAVGIWPRNWGAEVVPLSTHCYWLISVRSVY